jgi:hypothetical protein
MDGREEKTGEIYSSGSGLSTTFFLEGFSSPS